MAKIKETIEITAKDKTKAALAAASRSFKSLDGKMGAVIKTATVLASAGVLGALINKSLDTVDAIAKMSDAAGIATDALQELRFAAEQNGVSTDILDASMMRFNRRLGMAADGAGPAVKALKTLDISVRDMNGNVRDSEDVLDEVIEKISKYDSAAERAALSSKFFGDNAGPKMALLISKGTEGVAELRQEARDLGLVIDEDLLRATEGANDRMNVVSRQWGVGLDKLVAEHSGGMAAMAEASLILLDALGLLADAFGLVADAANYWYDSFSDVGKWMAGTKAQSSELQIDMQVIAQFHIELLNQQKELNDLRSSATLPGEDEDRETQITNMENEIEVTRRAIDITQARVDGLTLLEQQLKRINAISVNPNNALMAGGAFGAKEEKQAGPDPMGFAQGLGVGSAFGSDPENAMDYYLFAGTEDEFNEKLQRKLDAVTQESMTEQERLADAAVNRSLIVEQAFESELIDEERRQELLLDIRKRHVDAVLELESESMSEQHKLWESGLEGKLAVTGQVLGDISNLMQSESETAFRIGKAAAISETVINTYAAAMGAYKSLASIPYVGPTLGAAAALAAIKTGQDQVNRIKSQQPGSGSVATGTFPANPNTGQPNSVGSFAETPAPEPGTKKVVYINYTGIMGEEGTRGLISEINKQVGQGVELRVTAG